MAHVNGQRILTLVVVLVVLWGVLVFAVGLTTVWFLPTLAKGWHLGVTRTPGHLNTRAAESGHTSQPVGTQGGAAAQNGQGQSGPQNGAPAADQTEPQEAPKLESRLAGGQEVPANTSPATGKAGLKVDINQGRLCYKLDDVAGLVGNASAAHVQKAPAGSTGPVVATIKVSSGGESSDCLSGLDSKLLRDMLDHPENYYVNIRTSAFSDGEIRGQLAGEAQEPPESPDND